MAQETKTARMGKKHRLSSEFVGGDTHDDRPLYSLACYVRSKALASVTVVTVITEKATSLELHKSFESTVGPVPNE